MASFKRHDYLSVTFAILAMAFLAQVSFLYGPDGVVDARNIREYISLKGKCGDGFLMYGRKADMHSAAGEQCDDGNRSSGDGCSDTCKIEKGFRCTVTMNPTVCEQRCGDGVVDVPDEQCDDGNTQDGDGCTASCVIESGYACRPTGDNNVSARFCTIPCGDGYLGIDEECDDGNTDDGDGCSSTCVQEEGYACSYNGTSTASRCYAI